MGRMEGGRRIELELTLSFPSSLSSSLLPFFLAEMLGRSTSLHDMSTVSRSHHESVFVVASSKSREGSQR